MSLRVAKLTIPLNKKVKVEIELEETAKSVGTDLMFHLWADIVVDFETLKLIIKEGIKHLPQKNKDEMLAFHEEINV